MGGQKLDRALLTIVIIDYLQSLSKNMTQEKISLELNLTRESVNKWYNRNSTIRVKTFETRLCPYLSGKILEESRLDKFLHFLVDSLKEKGFNARIINELVLSVNVPKLNQEKSPKTSKELTACTTYLLTLFETLMEKYTASNSTGLLKGLKCMQVVKHFASYCYPYNDYFLAMDNIIQAKSTTGPKLSKLIYIDDFKDSGISEMNYQILRFAGNYHVLLVLSNFPYTDGKEKPDDQDLSDLESCLEYLTKRQNFKMIIIFTDNQLNFKTQQDFLDKYNVYFERITPEHLKSTDTRRLQVVDFLNRDFGLSELLYANVMFDRFISYLPVIRNEIFFRSELTKDCIRNAADKIEERLNIDARNRAELDPDQEVPEQLYEQCLSDTDWNSFAEYTLFTDNTLLKEIFSYGYLTRHSIHFGRNLVYTEAEKLYNRIPDKKQRKLKVIELCAPVGMLSSRILNFCEELHLLSSSREAFRKLHEYEHKLFPPSVKVELSHVNPGTLNAYYAEQFSKRMDLVILGFGKGSSIVNLTEYINIATSWLNEDGIIIITFTNSNSVVLQNKMNITNVIEATPAGFDELWEYRPASHSIDLDFLQSMATRNDHLSNWVRGTRKKTDTLRFLCREMTYDTEEIKSRMKQRMEICETYTYPFLSALITPQLMDRRLLDEIRAIDKDYAMPSVAGKIRKSGQNGHYIFAVGRAPLDSIEPRVNDLQEQIDGWMKKNLNAHRIVNINHNPTTSVTDLRSTLSHAPEMTDNTQLLKTIILFKEKSNEYSYVIMPYDRRMDYDKDTYKLVKTSEITSCIGRCCLPPFLGNQELQEQTNWKGKTYLYGIRNQIKEYVVFSSGKSTLTYKLLWSDFMLLLKIIGCENWEESLR